MSERPFPKPPPADPLPLETWLDQADRSEVGREPFFRGRDAEFDVFRRAAGSLHDGRVGGGTMVFQGAPGAGKSALMEECLEAVRRHSTPEAPWVALALNPGSLRYPDKIVRGMVDAANTESERLRREASGAVSRLLGEFLDRGRQILHEIPDRNVSLGGVSWSGREREVSAEGLFEHVAPLLGKFHIVVCVDEAQNTPVSGDTKGLLDCLHRDPQGIPLVAAFFGLSDTTCVLRRCGLSGFARGRVVTLAPLPHEDSARAIRDVFGAYGFTGAPEHREAWVDRLAELSQGRPQHINCVAIAASRVIRANGGRIDAAHLDEAVAAGEAYKREYYAGRLEAASGRHWIYRDLALAMERNGGVLAWDGIESLTGEVRGRTGESMEDFLTDALHAGLLAPDRELPDHYRIPIPSLGDYLRALPAAATI